MNIILPYLIEVLLCSVIMLLNYLLFLRNKEFHAYNRFYLLAASIISWVIPSLRFEPSVQLEPKQISKIRLGEVINDYSFQITNFQNSTSSSWSWQLFFISVAALISALLLLHLLYTLLRIILVIKNSHIQHLKGCRLIMTKEGGAPFSFFGYIFWNPSVDIASDYGRKMLNHELVHIKEKHSIDKLFSELMIVIGWWNPFFWFIKKELYLVHEFIADSKSINKFDTTSLAEILLLAAYPKQYGKIANPFFFSPIKRRITMISNLSKPRFSLTRKLFLIPIVSILVLLFSFRSAKNEISASPIQLRKVYTVVLDAGHGGIDQGASALSGEKEKDLSLSIVKKIAALNNNPNIKLVFTRESDEFISVKQRTQLAKDVEADLFVSIHMNGGTSNNRGLQIFIPNDENNKFYNNSRLLASSIKQNMEILYQQSEMSIIKTKQSRSWILDNAPCPSALIHPGFITNSADLEKIKKTEDEIAGKISEGINIYLTSLE